MNNQDFIDKIVQVANKTIPTAEIYLYGSRARGDNNQQSDWDLIILLNSSKPSFALETQIIDAFYELELSTNQVVSPLIYTKDDWISNYTQVPLFQSVKQEGIRIK